MILKETLAHPIHGHGQLCHLCGNHVRTTIYYINHDDTRCKVNQFKMLPPQTIREDLTRYSPKGGELSADSIMGRDFVEMCKAFKKG